MSRILAELLGVSGPAFRATLAQLEQASGNPAVDIRLSTEVTNQAKEKLRELGLDPSDTNGPELYNALNLRLEKDNERLEKSLRINFPANNIMHSVGKSLSELSLPKNTFAIKHSVAKKLLKKRPPKVTLKRLGFRSFDSLIKKEPTAIIVITAFLLEGEHWCNQFLSLYNSLKPNDFETRDIELIFPVRTKRWETLAEEIAQAERSTVLSSKELGAVILLPLPVQLPASTLTTTLLTLQAMNNIRLFSAFAKLQQVKQDFGKIISDAAKGDVRTLALMAGQPLPWHVIQKYYSRSSENYPLEIFEPHVHHEDLQLIDSEAMLTELEPSLEFWQGTAGLAYLHEHEIVSLNIKDLSVAASNRLPYSSRILTYFRDNLWSELMMQYMTQKTMEEKVVQQLDAQLVNQDIFDEPSFNFAGALGNG